MCIVSAVMDYGDQLWPKQHPWMTPIVPDIPPIEVAPSKPITLKDFAKKEQGRLPTAEEIKAFKKLVEAAERFDQIANQPHCEDPEKIKLLQRLEERLARIEGAVGVVDEPAPAEVSADTLAFARALYGYFTSSVSEYVDRDHLQTRLEQKYPTADVGEAIRRAEAAKALLHGEAQ
ncbi:hypothetical protein HOU00_gp055 [Caulobacter phage CcrPW]|uniref:Uncharacterized protein n=1 Tax=Caulobacter phage CcrPW TaxID=2283271 RepID=A0A385E9R4_9CAUD|nr:hypothetical protein HOU00_gp055 [Caulobacter phage CcrPW]AXQ68594.1 hypothetical protein CcrPW_gp055 [Caulobacter phage CcrPW]